MENHKELFEKVCSFENLHLAYLKARKHKRYRREILEFSYNLENNLLELMGDLKSQKYRHGGYRKFIVCDSKKREIKAASFRDRLVHHALCNIITAIFDKGFIYDSYVCRKNKGTHKAIKRLEHFLRSTEDVFAGMAIYVLQCDVSKYFENIDHKILFELIAKKIKGRKILWLIKEIIESDNKEIGKGIPIGNLTSQLFANVYLNELDQFLKHSLKVKYCIRYMDDFLILDVDKNRLRDFKQVIQNFLRNRLKLQLHPKKANVFPAEKGIDFLGYRIFRNYKLLRKSTVRRFIKRMKIYGYMLGKRLITEEKIRNSLRSWLAYAEFGNSWRLLQKLNYVYGFFK